MRLYLPFQHSFCSSYWNGFSCEKKNRSLYRLNDTLADLSCGISQQILRAFAKAFVVGGYVYVYTHFAFFSWSKESAWTWLFAF